jgi:hypothetical protein
LTTQPARPDLCSDCGTAIDHHHGEERCPACFDKYLFDLDVGFLDSYRKFGARSRLIVAETCLRGLVLESPDHRKVLAMTIFEQYIGAMNDLAGLFSAFLNRGKAPILKSFLEFRLDAQTTPAFFDAVRSVNDVELCAALGLPLPREAQYKYDHLSESEAYDVAIAIYHLVQDLRKATSQGDVAAMALAQFAGQISNAVISADAKWLNGAASGLTPDQVAMLVLDTRRRSFMVQGLSAEEGPMAQVVDAIDTATRATSNLIFAYLQTNDL